MLVLQYLTADTTNLGLETFLNSSLESEKKSPNIKYSVNTKGFSVYFEMSMILITISLYPFGVNLEEVDLDNRLQFICRTDSDETLKSSRKT